MKVILKSYRDKTIEEVSGYKDISKQYDEADNLVYDYRRLLIQEGWIDFPQEGGVISPDHSTLFITTRIPYNGQLLLYTENKKDEYLLIVNKFIESGIFIQEK